MEDVLNTFYSKIIPESLNGTVDCEIHVRIIFNVFFAETGHFLSATNKYPGVLIPTFTINNKQLFDSYLKEYVETMLAFYKDANVSSVPSDMFVAYIISTAIANMGAEDYLEPENYFLNRCKAIKQNKFDLNSDFQHAGYSDIFSADMCYVIEKEKPNEECPFKFTLYLKSNEDAYEFQTIRFYIIDDVCYIGAIQGNGKHNKTPFEKKVNRTLYKANEAIDENNSLYQTNPGAVVAITAFIAFLTNHNVEKVTIMHYGIQRWNDKKILYHNLDKKIKSPETSEKAKIKVQSIIERTEGYFSKADHIREQLNNALMRFNYHFYGQDEVQGSTKAIVQLYNPESGNNTLLNETFTLLSDLEHKKTNH